jgi:serine/threonine protein kinase
MGEVFRARDARLGRDVAIKTLPAAFADSPERRRRFEQEARAAGALSHPNIVAVYDAGEQGDLAYIVSELVEGESLRDLIRRGPAPVRKVIDLAAQIAEGLSAAHAAGIVHRDLKPENVMLSREGRAKILDFGLARYEPAKVAVGGGTMTMTNPGMIMGTPGYMSPEQVAGQPTEAQTDIFSLGIIIFEMLAGKQAFERATTIETMNAILRDDPPELPVAVPPALQSIVLHCLEKEPVRRYQSAQDLAFALRALSGSSIATVPKLAPVKPRPRILPVAAGVLALIAAYALAGLLLAPRGAILASYRFRPLASDSEPDWAPSWSPDGKSVAFVRAKTVGPNELLIRGLESMIPSVAAKANSHDAPIWSRDASRLFFITPDGIQSVGRAGGLAQTVLKGELGGADLSPDNQAMAIWLIRDSQEHPTAKMWISSPPGSAPRKYQPVVWEETGSTSPVYVRFSPDGRQIAVSVTRGGGAELWLLPYPDGATARFKPHRVFSSSLPGLAPSISWMPDSRHMVLAFAAPYTMSQLWMGDTQSGTLAPITSGEGRMSRAAVSPDGARIAFESVNADSDLVEIPLEGGMLRPLLITARDESAVAWSPKGSQFAFATSRNGRPEIWVRSTQEGWERPAVTQSDFPDDTLGFYALTFSPDGERLAYMRNSSRRLAAIWISPAAGGQPVRIGNPDDYEFGPTWSPDSNWLAYSSAYGGLVKVAVGGSQSPVKLRENACQQPARWSPDGQWIACPDKDNIALVSPDGKTTRNAGNRSGMLAWTRDSKSLLILGTDAGERWKLGSIDIQSGSEKPLATLPLEPISFFANISNSSTISLSPDGKSVAATKTTERVDVWMLEGFEHPRSMWSRLWWWR